jgi:hypothetical protein
MVAPEGRPGVRASASTSPGLAQGVCGVRQARFFPAGICLSVASPGGRGLKVAILHNANYGLNSCWICEDHNTRALCKYSLPGVMFGEPCEERAGETS